MRTFPCILAAAFFAASALPVAAQRTCVVATRSYPSADTQFIAGASPEKQADAVRLLHARLLADEVAAGVERALVVTVTPDEIATIAAPNPFEHRYRVGLAKPVGVTVDLGAAGEEALAFGARRETAGDVVWTGVVRAPGASALRLHLTGFDLPRGVELHVYSADGQAYGPYVRRGPVDDGELTTHTILGDELRLQLRVRNAGRGRPGGVRLAIAHLGWLGERFLAGGEGGTAKVFCADNAACVLNVECAADDGFDVPPAVTAARPAIAHLLFVSGAYYYMCTGGLVADADMTDTRAHLLTAHHCISSRSEASSLETYFDYWTPCGGSCTRPYVLGAGVPRYPNTLGATVAKTASASDYSLLRLSSPPGGSRAYLGWTAAPIVGSGLTLHRISHPSAAPQAYSRHQEVDPTIGICRSWPRGSWIYEHDVLGATEGGSSGSPVLAIVDTQAKLVGQLSGSCGLHVEDNCDADSNSTVDGAFAAYYDDVASILGGATSCKPRGATCTATSECCANLTCTQKGKKKTCS